MTHELDTTRAVRSWLEEGVTHLPDRVLDAVLADLPDMPQRRRSTWTDVRAWKRSTWVRLLVALMTLAIIGSSLAIATGAWRQSPTPRPFEVRPLDAGRYVIDAPFPVRISLDLPAGWDGDEITSNTARIVHRDAAIYPAAVFFTLVDAVYPDPCRFDETSIEVVGPEPDDLTAALATLRGVTVDGPRAVTIGGYSAQTLTMTAPDSFAGCSTTDPRFMIWGLPESHWLAEGEVNRIWVAEVGTTRLVIATEAFPNTPPEIVAQVDAMVASIQLGEFAVAAVPTTRPATPLPSLEPTIAPLPAGTALQETAYLKKVTVYDFDATGQAVPVDVMDAVLEGQIGWTATSRGIASDPGPPPPASLSWWNVGTVYRDPCHWDASPLGSVDPALLRTQEGLRDALSRWEPLPAAPRLAAEPIAVAWLGLVHQIRLTIPDDVDLSTCDAGQYRLWTEHDGTPRLGYPGEHVQIDIIDLDPGLLVVDTSWRQAASVVERGQAEAARGSLWIGPPREPTASP